MQHSPVGLDLEHMKSEILKLTEVEEIHDLHAWSLDGEHHVLSLHVVLAEDGVDPAKLKIRIREVIHGFGEFHSTIEVETKAEMCLNNCQ